MKSKFSILLAVLALAVATLACSLGGELSLENIRTATDSQGEQPTTVFSSSDTLYVVADLSNAPAGTTVEAKWFLVNVPEYEAGEISTETESVLSINEDEAPFSGTVNFSLSNTNEGWPAGDYKVEVYMNGELKSSLSFSVK